MDGPGASGEDKPMVRVSTLGDADWSRTQLTKYPGGHAGGMGRAARGWDRFVRVKPGDRVRGYG